jgi:DNA polymerase I-like protein with 3'-5' exonuclease and polymerase domains
MILSIDTETTGTHFFHGCKPFLVGACDGEDIFTWEGEVNPYNREVYWSQSTVYDLQETLDKASALIFHNAQFDIRALSTIGIKVDHLWQKVEDTLIASHLVCSGDSHGLKDLGIKYLDHFPLNEELLDQAVSQARTNAPSSYAIAKKGIPQHPSRGPTKWAKMDMWLCPEEVRPYLYDDLQITYGLFDPFKTEIMINGWGHIYKKRLELLRLFYNMTSVGLYFHYGDATRYIQKQELKKEELRKEVRDRLGIKFRIDLDNREHISSIFSRLKIPLFMSKNGKPKFDKKSINEYAEYAKDMDPLKFPVIECLQKYNKIKTKIGYVTSYCAHVAEDSCIHGNYNVTGTRETRAASSQPNMQNIDRVLKMFFGPPPGYVWLELDLVNIELCIWAYETGNKELIEAFESGKSVHLIISSVICPMLLQHGTNTQIEEASLFISGNINEFKETKTYTEIKSGTFAWIYGGTELKVNQTYFSTSSKNPPNATRAIGERFEGVIEFIESIPREIEKHMKLYERPCVIGRSGYPLDVPLDEMFKGTNYKIQGAAGDIIADAMIAVDRNDDYKNNNCAMVSNIHDYLAIQIPINPKLPRIIFSILEAVEDAGRMIVPTCNASYKIKYNEDDKDNPLLSDYVTPF